MEIRNITKDDYPKVICLLKKLDFIHIQNRADIRSDTFEVRYQQLYNNLFEKDLTNYVCIVCIINNVIIGIAQGKLIKIKNNLLFKDIIIGEITNVYVEENYKRLGIAKKLMAELEAQLILKGAEKLELRVYSFNKEAKPKSVGYIESYTLFEKPL